MAYTQIFTSKNEYLLCITDGVVDDAETFIEWALKLVAKAREARRTRILVDNRTLRLDLSPLDIITFANFLEDQGTAKLGLRLAVLSNPHNPETSRLVETALVNRSASYRSFRSQQEAQEWLLGEPLLSE
ncbi:hypothetical protein DND132_0644 [Pseudodesulfovibrio mercurii]|uniref:STAS/SEC14 domain-containing protein n=1 Tax=Pseudodesulfovibrio mercurii TaxID=641491 RepID=F0JGJ1_9BACT|nr:hypothetical protein [Pseudodesulfovibrio mercurii]EGB13860.1 hypothetical protein DND132_0644 [Pseudodesulfovibrio mercurii]